MRKILSLTAVMIAAIAVTGCGNYSASNGLNGGMHAALKPATMGAQPQVTVGGTTPSISGGHSYYVDCSRSSYGSGTEASPWGSIYAATQRTYQPGDTIYFKRGTTCHGEFRPKGSGSSSAPITVTAYGHGQLPIINGGSTNHSAIYLTNQSYWTFENLDVKEGLNWGIIAKALNDAQVYGLTIRNVVATGVTSVAKVRAVSGEIGLVADGNDYATINDVNISHVTVGDTKAGEGIFVKAGYGLKMYRPKGDNISITDSKVSNVYGDGILVSNGENITISHNSVSKSGQCPTGECRKGSGSIWVFNSLNAELSWNESFDNSSPNGDGGGMHADYFNRNVTIENNYIQDNKDYCLAVFGANHQATFNSVIRWNVCVNNDARPDSVDKGDVLLSTWNGGSLNGVQIYNNTFYWTAASQKENYELMDNAVFHGKKPDFYRNNLVYSTLAHPYFVHAAAPLQVDNNLYYSPNASESTFEYNGAVWNSFAAYQKGSGQDKDSVDADPLLGDPGYDVYGIWPKDQYTPHQGSPAIGAGANVCVGISGCSMGTSDFFGKPLPKSGFWIGAIQEKYNQMSATGMAHSH